MLHLHTSPHLKYSSTAIHVCCYNVLCNQPFSSRLNMQLSGSLHFNHAGVTKYLEYPPNYHIRGDTLFLCPSIPHLVKSQLLDKKLQALGNI